MASIWLSSVLSALLWQATATPAPVHSLQLPWLAILLLQLQDIEHRQYSEEQAALRHFDARLGLRAKTLAELRAMAQ